MRIGVSDRMTYPCLVLLLAGWTGRREETVVDHAGLSNQADSLALRLWDKSNNFAQIRSITLVREEIRSVNQSAVRRPKSSHLLSYGISPT
jgi:hypothetical protein